MQHNQETKLLHCTIATISKIILDEQILFIQFVTYNEGRIQIWPQHAPWLFFMIPGQIKVYMQYRKQEEQREQTAKIFNNIGTGICEVKNNTVLICVTEIA
jgi:F0F1-type ATP synthase epsilon subunit